MTDAAFTSAARATSSGYPPLSGFDTPEPTAVELLLERAQDAIAFQGERADKAEAELAALAGSLGATAGGERERNAAKLNRVRETAAGFLTQYGDSDILMFKVGQDLATAVLKILNDPGGEAGSREPRRDG